jgi:hypothetical protein
MKRFRAVLTFLTVVLTLAIVRYVSAAVNLTTIAVNAAANSIVGRTPSPAWPTTLYLGWFSTTPTSIPAGTGGVEATAQGAYARVATAIATFWTAAASGGAIANTATITCPTGTTGTPSVLSAGWFDALTAGNLWIVIVLGSAYTYGPGVVPTVNSGSGTTTFV